MKKPPRGAIVGAVFDDPRFPGPRYVHKNDAENEIGFFEHLRRERERMLSDLRDLEVRCGDEHGNHIEVIGHEFHITAGEDDQFGLAALHVFGNAHYDGDNWRLVYALARDERLSIAHRAAAIRKMDELTGEDESSDRDDETLVREYMEELEALESNPSVFQADQ